MDPEILLGDQQRETVAMHRNPQAMTECTAHLKVAVSVNELHSHTATNQIAQPGQYRLKTRQFCVRWPQPVVEQIPHAVDPSGPPTDALEETADHRHTRWRLGSEVGVAEENQPFVGRNQCQVTGICGYFVGEVLMIVLKVLIGGLTVG